MYYCVMSALMSNMKTAVLRMKRDQMPIYPSATCSEYVLVLSLAQVKARAAIIATLVVMESWANQRDRAMALRPSRPASSRQDAHAAVESSTAVVVALFTTSASAGS